ncbi:MAG: hypothetical protein J7M25_12190 [Deltaproteobacteria bacterium]|nr:hypothetical protein [Deltaproteobacteria bacterium]
MLDKFKEMAITHGMKLISDPRVMKLMSDPRVMNMLTKTLELQGKVSEGMEDAGKKVATIFRLASHREYQELKEELISLRERLESVERTR